MSDLARVLEARATELNLTQTHIAKMIGIAPASISLLFNGHVARPRRWREIARVLQIDEKLMVNLMRQSSPERLDWRRRPQQAKPEIGEGSSEPLKKTDNSKMGLLATPRPGPRLIPILGELTPGEHGGYVFDGTIKGYTACPPALVDVTGAYATFVGGDLMSPRYKSSEIIWVHPHRPARKGDDVIVQTRSTPHEKGNRGVLREFLGWESNELTLSQYSNRQRTAFNRTAVSCVHVVVGASRY